MGAIQNPVANPLGGPTISGTTITVDALTNPPTIIPEVIRSLVASNEGYFIERVFQTGGFTVNGGAIIYTESFPEDLFLPDDQSIAPRAPGSEAPLLGSTRRAPKVARPESWSGSIEVHDEARRRNLVRAITRQFQQAANTFADRLQTRGIETLYAAVAAWGRQGVGLPWRNPTISAAGVPNADPTTLPGADFANVFTQFVNDRVGVRPDLLIIHPDDANRLDVLYPNNLLRDLLDRYNLTMLVTVQAQEGAPLFVASGQVGVMAFEKPLEQEYTREGKRFTDVYSMETVPVFVADAAEAVWQLTGVDATA